MNNTSSSVDNKMKQEAEAHQCVTLTKMEEIEEDEEMYEHANSPSSLRDNKKRRLSVEQVKALEKNFEVENKLDPERKTKIASELGLQPRQVAVWFQNRRARWKTKQLERDYGVLKDRYNSLKNEVDTLRNDKESLNAEIMELKAKLANNCALKMECKVGGEDQERPAAGWVFKDGASDSDSSVVFNDEASVVLDQHSVVGLLRPQYCSTFLFDEIKFKEEYLDEGLIMSGEELCSSWFSEEQAPSFSWY